jgi:hypothetical protein
MPVKKCRKRDSQFEARVRSIVARLIGERVEEVVRTTIVEQLALRFGAVPDARKARAVIRAFRPDWYRRGTWKEMMKSIEEDVGENDGSAIEAPKREKVTSFSPPRLVR